VRSVTGAPAFVLGGLLLAATGGGLGTTCRAADGDAIAHQVSRVDEGCIYLSFASRPDVFGDGDNIVTHRHGRDDFDCGEEGPVQVRLRVGDGAVRDVRVRVGGRWRDTRDTDVDLGVVPVAEATAYFLSLARQARERVAEDAIVAVALADSVQTWPDLLAIARDDDRPGGVRESAIFWLGQAAGDAATRGLASLVDDGDESLDLREHAVFSLSQRPSDECVPALSEIALHNAHPRLRRSALFWLAQHDDPRVLDLFEEILRGD
jgi:hypothetical protein